MVSDGTTLDFSVYHNKRKIATKNASFESSGCASAPVASTSGAGGSASKRPRASNRQMSHRPDPDYNEESGSEVGDNDSEMED